MSQHIDLEKGKDALQKAERGASLVEYALLVALIAAVTIGAVRTIGTNANNKLTTVGNQLK
jgi:pilus assembly protein Flp/PilA